MKSIDFKISTAMLYLISNIVTYMTEETEEGLCHTKKVKLLGKKYWMLGAGALGQPRGMVWGGRREEGSGWGNTCIPVEDSF